MLYESLIFCHNYAKAFKPIGGNQRIYLRDSRKELDTFPIFHAVILLDSSN